MYTVKNGTTPVLIQDEARERHEKIDTSTSLGIRNRPLIAMMNYFPPNAYYAGSTSLRLPARPTGRTPAMLPVGLDPRPALQRQLRG